MRGIFLVRATHGYTVQVDEATLDLDVSWAEANRLAQHIARLRPACDGRGYARCQHEGNSRCFATGVHLAPQPCEFGFDSTGVGGWCVTHRRWQCPGSS